MTTPDKLRKWRDAKVAPHLKQYAPVWLESETIEPDEDVIIFNVVFRHPAYGWVSRRYRYDGFNDVLYYSGQRVITEEAALALQDKAPYMDALQSDVVNSYGG
jgi:hypothetical protein